MSDESNARLMDATAELGMKVVSLADNVLILTHRIDRFKKEINQKPDDEELKFLEREMDRRRRYGLGRMALFAAISLVLSCTVTYKVANYESRQRCLDSQAHTDTLVNLLREFNTDGHQPLLTKAIKDLTSKKVDCR